MFVELVYDKRNVEGLTGAREIILNELTKRVHRIFPDAEVKVKPMQANGLNSDASKSDREKLNRMLEEMFEESDMWLVSSSASFYQVLFIPFWIRETKFPYWMNHCRPFLKLLYQRIKIMILALHSFMHLAQHYIRVAAKCLVTIDKLICRIPATGKLFILGNNISHLALKIYAHCF